MTAGGVVARAKRTVRDARFALPDLTALGRKAPPRTSASETRALRPGRKVAECFECNHRHEVAGTATSSLCPACGSYIDLRDFEIRDRTHQNIRTRGAVIVHRKAVLATPGIYCGDLTVNGQVSGTIHSSGTVHFRTEGRVLGEIHCRHFILDRRSEIQFLGHIHADTAEIHGRMTGDICTRHELAVSAGASITGAVLAGTMKMDPGGRIDGPMCILSRANLASIKANPQFKELAATFDFAD